MIYLLINYIIKRKILEMAFSFLTFYDIVVIGLNRQQKVQ